MTGLGSMHCDRLEFCSALSIRSNQVMCVDMGIIDSLPLRTGAKTDC